jgi:hypothetical protein
MPSDSFANPPSQIAQSASSATQRDKENIALPVLQEVEISYETECLLDFQGRRHLDREASDQQYYFGQPEDASPSFTDFPMPGQASVDTLRNFLRRHLQPDQIVDEYGNMCDISAISNDHLPVLQAKLWVRPSKNRSPVEATVQRPSRAQNLIAGHVSRISQLLEGTYVSSLLTPH